MEEIWRYGWQRILQQELSGGRFWYQEQVTTPIMKPCSTDHVLQPVLDTLAFAVCSRWVPFNHQTIY